MEQLTTPQAWIIAGDPFNSEIQVRVDDGEVTLEGIVEDSLAKRRAEDVAYSTRGVRDVHNRLRVDRRVREVPIAPGQRERRSGSR